MTPRRGFALAASLAILCLLAVLAVATLAVTTRLEQNATLAERDGALSSAASIAVTTPIREWRSRSLSSMMPGETRSIPISGPPSVVAQATITRLGAELFWLVGEAVAVDGSRRRESLIMRLTLPIASGLAVAALTGDATLSRSFAVTPDSAPGCLPATDLIMRPSASLSSADGTLPPLRLTRDAVAADSAHALGLDSVAMDGLVRGADLTISAGGSTAVSSGITHASGDLTLTGGEGSGILIVDGRLTIAGPLTFDGLVIARELRVLDGAPRLKGGVRLAPGYGYSGSMSAPGGFALAPSACAVQSALLAAVRPRPVAGRRWAELY